MPHINGKPSDRKGIPGRFFVLSRFKLAAGMLTNPPVMAGFFMAKLDEDRDLYKD